MRQGSGDQRQENADDEGADAVTAFERLDGVSGSQAKQQQKPRQRTAERGNCTIIEEPAPAVANQGGACETEHDD